MILVTGGTGLVGSHLLYNLCLAGERVRAIKRPTSNTYLVRKLFLYYNTNGEVLFNQIEWVDADLVDIYSLTEALNTITHIYHAAAVVAFEPNRDEEMIQANIEGTANIINAALAAKIEKFCHVSSIAAIGRPDNVEYISEEYFWKASPDNSAYSISKYGAEREVWRGAEEGLKVVIVNPSLIIGPGDWSRSTGNMFAKAYHGIKFYTNGASAFIDVRDVATLMILLMNSNINDQRFILSTQNQSYRTFFNLIHQAFGKPIPKYYAGKLLSNIAWRFEALRSRLTNTNPLITKETALSAHTITKFSTKKIELLIPDYRYISFEQSIIDTCAAFLNDNKNKN